jgi:hypothetical protein
VEHEPIDDETDHDRTRHRRDEADVEGQPGESRDRVREVCPEHVELPVGKVDHVHVTEDEGQAGGHQGVDASQCQTVHEELSELAHFGAPS